MLAEQHTDGVTTDVGATTASIRQNTRPAPSSGVDQQRAEGANSGTQAARKTVADTSRR